MPLYKILTKKGFTLIELLLVVAIISLLAGIVIIAINPNKQMSDARNANRRIDVNTILSAVYQYSLENNSLPLSITTTSTEICKTGASSCSGLIDLSVLTTNEKYLTALPVDPQCPTGCSANGNGYRISRSSNNRITVSSINAEQSVTISVTR